MPPPAQDESLITYLVLSGLDYAISETQIINAIAPHIRVFVSGAFSLNYLGTFPLLRK